MCEIWFQSLGWEDTLEQGMATTPVFLPLQNSMDRGPWQTIVHGVAESEMTKRLSTALTSIHEYWKNHSFDYVDLSWQCDECLVDTQN